MSSPETGGRSPEQEVSVDKAMAMMGETYSGLVEAAKNSPVAQALLGLVILGSVEGCGGTLRLDARGVVHGRLGNSDVALTTKPQFGKGGGSVDIKFTPDDPRLGGAGEKKISNF